MKLTRILAVVAALSVFVLAAFLVHAIRNAQEAARDLSCQGRLNQLQQALSNYEYVNGHLPPAYILGPDGQPWHSWRVLLLPHMEGQDVFDQYRFDEPWNGPNNRRLADQISIDRFQCPGGSDFEQTYNTNYVALVGEGTAFPGDKTTRFTDFSDGKENTILLVEMADSGIHWMEPRDIELDSLAVGHSSGTTPAISSPHPKGPAVVFADHIRAYRLAPSMRAETLRGLAPIAGNEPITRESLFREDHAAK
jgi:hypothetical protein